MAVRLADLSVVRIGEFSYEIMKLIGNVVAQRCLATNWRVVFILFVDDPKNRKLKFIFLILGIVTAAVLAGLTVIRDAAEALLQYLIPH